MAAALLLNAIILLSTVAMQIPLQIRLGEGGLSPDVLDQLLETDRIRQAGAALKAFLYLWMMSLVVQDVAANKQERDV